jgi:hemolysin III
MIHLEAPVQQPVELPGPGALPRYSRGEEIAHCATHGAGLLLSLAGLAALVATARTHADSVLLAACSVFGFSLILLYLTSTLYHGIPSPRAKRVLRVLDHSAIFLLIAGTYTPFTLVSLRGPWGYWLFGTVWGMALVGILFKAFATGRLRRLSVVFYLAMGWCVLVALEPLMAALAPEGVRLLFLGGIAYTAGVVFYAWRRLPYHHAVWHLFVLAGSVLHFLAVLLYVIPPRG